MLLKLLERLDRKKLVLDRGPSHPDYKNAKLWINRYYLLFRHRPRWFPFNILIHEMLDNDHGEGVHSHLCPYITLILRGGYWETLKNGKIVFNRYRNFTNMFEELTNFGVSSHDDCVDALVWLVNGLVRKGKLQLDY